MKARANLEKGSVDEGSLKVYFSGSPIVEVMIRGKKVAVLVTVCFVIVAVAFFEFFVFRTPVQQTISVNEITSNPSAWLNRTVVVEGNLSGPIFNISRFSPWQYNLTSASARIGVFWSMGVGLNGSVAVKVYGVVRKVTVIYDDSGISKPSASTIVYYIEAEKVELL